jgi:hypothetical protein
MYPVGDGASRPRYFGVAGKFTAAINHQDAKAQSFLFGGIPGN